MNRDNLISLCTPVEGSDAGLEVWLREAAATLAAHYENYEIILIGNGLRGQNLAAARRLVSATPKARLVTLANHCDEDVVYSAALDTAIGDAVLLTDCRHDPLAPLPEMAEKILGGSDIVLAHNLTPPPEPVWHRLLAACYYRLVEALVRAPLDFDRSHFSGYSRAAVNLMTRQHGHIRNLRLLRNTLGVDTITVDYRYADGTPRRRFDLASRIFARAEEALSLSVRPLRIVAMLCLLAAIINVLYGVYIVAMRLFTVTAPGWASAELAQSSMMTVLFFALGILAMNLNIILQETQRRPLYTVLDECSGGTTGPLQRRNVVE